jgi:hypothetical protein
MNLSWRVTSVSDVQSTIQLFALSLSKRPYHSPKYTSLPGIRLLSLTPNSCSAEASWSQVGNLVGKKQVRVSDGKLNDLAVVSARLKQRFKTTMKPRHDPFADCKHTLRLGYLTMHSDFPHFNTAAFEDDVEEIEFPDPDEIDDIDRLLPVEEASNCGENIVDPHEQSTYIFDGRYHPCPTSADSIKALPHGNGKTTGAVIAALFEDEGGWYQGRIKRHLEGTARDPSNIMATFPVRGKEGEYEDAKLVCTANNYGPDKEWVLVKEHEEEEEELMEFD